MGFAQDERKALCELMLEVGPGAPTLCEGWDAHDLAVHLRLRETNPLAAPGMIVERFAPLTERISANLKAKLPFAELVGLVRSGPPALSPFRLLDEQANTVEYYIHHEDVRRAATSWEPRELSRGLEDALWTRVGGMAKMLLRKAPVGVRLEWEGTGRSVAVKPGSEIVTVVGTPGELALFVSGRTSVAKVDLIGTDEAVAALTGTDLSF